MDNKRRNRLSRRVREIFYQVSVNELLYTGKWPSLNNLAYFYKKINKKNLIIHVFYSEF